MPPPYAPPSPPGAGSQNGNNDDDDDDGTGETSSNDDDDGGSAVVVASSLSRLTQSSVSSKVLTSQYEKASVPAVSAAVPSAGGPLPQVTLLVIGSFSVMGWLGVAAIRRASSLHSRSRPQPLHEEKETSSEVSSVTPPAESV
jgi:hypothetical protein